MFDPVGGRFVSRDPIRFRGKQFGLYGYVGNRALIRWDPTGLIDGNGGGEYPGFAGKPQPDSPRPTPPQPSYPEPPKSGTGCCDGKSIDLSTSCCVNCGDKGIRIIDRSDTVTVSICYRTAQVPGGGPGRAFLGAFHMWLKTDCMEMGLGELGGGVPGVNEPGDSPSIYPPTAVNPHNGQAEQPGSFCVDIAINSCCIHNEMRPRPMFKTCGPGYNCNDFVEDSIQNCGVTDEQLDEIKRRAQQRDPNDPEDWQFWPFGVGSPI